MIRWIWSPMSPLSRSAVRLQPTGGAGGDLVSARQRFRFRWLGDRLRPAPLSSTSTSTAWAMAARIELSTASLSAGAAALSAADFSAGFSAATLVRRRLVRRLLRDGSGRQRLGREHGVRAAVPDAPGAGAAGLATTSAAAVGFAADGRPRRRRGSGVADIGGGLRRWRGSAARAAWRADTAARLRRRRAWSRSCRRRRPAASCSPGLRPGRRRRTGRCRFSARPCGVAARSARRRRGRRLGFGGRFGRTAAASADAADDPGRQTGSLARRRVRARRCAIR